MTMSTTTGKYSHNCFLNFRVLFIYVQSETNDNIKAGKMLRMATEIEPDFIYWHEK